MKALVKTAPGVGHVSIEEVPAPSVRAGWVLVEVIYAGICGTDLHIRADNHPSYPPVVLGHEFVGRIAELGEGVEGWRVGERVVCEPHALHCGVCPLCRRGLIRLCTSKRAPGWGIDGAFAPLVTVPAGLLHRVAGEVPDERAAVCEPSAIATRGVNRVEVNAGDRVAVLGPGPIGVVAALVAAARGADRVVLIGRASSAGRLRTAASLGVEVATGFDLADLDAVLDTTGSSAAMTAGLRMLRRAGRLATVGVGDETFTVPWQEALFRSVDIRFSFSSAYEDWRAALSLMRRGVLRTDRLTTVFDLADWESAFAAVAGRSVTKALLRP